MSWNQVQSLRVNILWNLVLYYHEYLPDCYQLPIQNKQILIFYYFPSIHKMIGSRFFV